MGALPRLPRLGLILLAVLAFPGAIAAGYLVAQPAYVGYVDGEELRVTAATRRSATCWQRR